MGKFLTIYIVLLFLSALTACQPINNIGMLEATPTFRLVSTTTLVIGSPTLSLRTRVPSLTLEVIATQSGPSDTFTSTVTPTTTEVSNILCSPLQYETIPSLWEIITNVFDPPPPGRDDHHHGVDFAYYRRGDRLSIEGEIVQSIFAGNVAASIQDRLPYGNMVIIETTQNLMPNTILDKLSLKAGESIYSLYAHLAEVPLVEKGDSITCGQPLGKVGKTGYDIVNPHLHLETRIGPSGVSFEGMAFYDTSATTEEMDNYLRWRTSGNFKPVDPMTVFADYLSDAIVDIQTPSP